MSYDLVEFALEKYTDFTLFERLATEIMMDQGYSSIIPLGGVFDEGQDAIYEKHYIGEGVFRTVFQYSLQENVADKVIKTIEKLRVNGIEYQKLIIVTSRVFTAQQQITLNKNALSDYNKDLEIYDRERIIPIIADSQSGLMARYFPDIKKQIDIYYGDQKDDISETKESSFLKTCSIFYYDKDAEIVRKNFIDKLIIEILALSSRPVSGIPELVTIINTKITARAVDDSQVSNAIVRLRNIGAISETNGISLSSGKRMEIGNIESKLKQNVNALISDITTTLRNTSGSKISREEEGYIRANSLRVIVACFRQYGYEIAKQLTEGSKIRQVLDINDGEFLECAKNNLSDKLGRLLLAAIAEVFFEPNDEQYIILSDMCRSYLASVILSIDPVLAEFQITRFAKKTFILDTDFVLDTINEYCPQRSKNLKTLESLLSMDCRIVIPRNCILECINHARISDRTYNHFYDTLLSLPPELVEQHVWNVFVKGYYYFRKANTNSKISFLEYKNNYYEVGSEYAFMLDVVKSMMPTKINIVEQKDLIDEQIEQVEIKKLGDTIYEIMKDSRKAKYRTEDEMRDIAYLDAELYLIALKINAQDESEQSGLLSQSAYIISESNRYIKAVSRIDKYKNIVIRSYSIYSLLRLIGSVKKPRNEMDTLADPLLSKIVSDIWDDVERIIKNGIRLDNMSITRLRWDLDGKIHDRLIKIDENDLLDDTQPVGADDDYIVFLKSFKEKGYSLAPEAEQLIKIVTDDRATIAKLESEKKKSEDIIEEIMKKSEEFGKKKQRYLRKILKK